jgi:hypothetical protein
VQTTATQEARGTALRIGRLLGAAGAIFSLLAVFVMVAAAQANQPYVLAMQRALVSFAGNGGADPIPLIGPLMPLFVATYGTALLTFGVSLGFAWYAGRTTALVTGQRRLGATAGFWVELISGGAWTLAALVAIALQFDGTLSWLLATVFYTLVSPPNNLAGGIATQPAPAYHGMQIVLFLLQVVVGVGTALGLGALAGRMGAGSVAPHGRTPAGAWMGQPAPH